MRRIRSLGNKVALLFFLITAAAFGVIYFYVVTQPESSLEPIEALIPEAFSQHSSPHAVSSPKLFGHLFTVSPPPLAAPRSDAEIGAVFRTKKSSK